MQHLPEFVYYKMSLGFVAALGHIFPVYLRFKGGKGVATFFGAMLSVFPIAGLCALAVFLIVFLASRYVSLSSMLAGISFPLTLLIVQNNRNIPVLAFASLISLLIIFTHRKNIARLLKGKENKIYFHKKNRP
jgi:glycerol-3-phosphate acyltransferase PlsY